LPCNSYRIYCASLSILARFQAPENRTPLEIYRYCEPHNPNTATKSHLQIQFIQITLGNHPRFYFIEDFPLLTIIFRFKMTILIDIDAGPEGAYKGSASQPEAKLDITRLPLNGHAILEPSHRLLYFTPLVERYAIASGKDKAVATITSSARLHGEFFLHPFGIRGSAAEDWGLMCYHQSLFSVAGTFTVPTTEGTAANNDHAWVLIQSWEVQLSAVEFPKGPAIKLHVTPPGQEHCHDPQACSEPKPIQLFSCLPNEFAPKTSSGSGLCEASWERLHFRTTTASTGKGRAEEKPKQFILQLILVANLVDGNKLNVAASQSAPISVRGRRVKVVADRDQTPVSSISPSQHGTPASAPNASGPSEDLAGGGAPKMTVAIDNQQRFGDMNFDHMPYANAPQFTNPWCSSSAPAQSHSLYASSHILNPNLGLNNMSKQQAPRMNSNLYMGSSLLADVYGSHDLLTMPQDLLSPNPSSIYRTEGAYLSTPSLLHHNYTPTSTPYDSMGYAPAPVRSTYAIQQQEHSRRLSQPSAPSSTFLNVPATDDAIFPNRQISFERGQHFPASSTGMARAQKKVLPQRDEPCIPCQGDGISCVYGVSGRCVRCDERGITCSDPTTQENTVIGNPNDVSNEILVYSYKDEKWIEVKATFVNDLKENWISLNLFARLDPDGVSNWRSQNSRKEYGEYGPLESRIRFWGRFKLQWTEKGDFKSKLAECRVLRDDSFELYLKSDLLSLTSTPQHVTSHIMGVAATSGQRSNGDCYEDNLMASQDQIVCIENANNEANLARVEADTPEPGVQDRSPKSLKEERKLGDTSTCISRDSGYYSRISVPIPKSSGNINQESTMKSTTGSKMLPRNFEDWESRSVASLQSRATDGTMSSLNPTALGGAAEEVAEVLVQRVEVRDLIAKGFQTMDIDRFERNFRRLLKEFAINLRKEALTGVQKSVTKLVHSYRAYVTNIIREKFALDHSHTQAEALRDIQKQEASKVMLERLLCNRAETSDPKADEAAAESDYGSGFSDNEEPILPNLEKVKEFMMSSAAFFELERRLREFVNPNPTFVAFVEGLRNSDDASNASPEDSQKQLPLPAEQISTVTFNASNLSNFEVNMLDACEARPVSPTDTMNLKPQTKDEHNRHHNDAGSGGSVTPLKRAWDPNDEKGHLSKRRNIARFSVETQRPVYSSIPIPTNFFLADEDIEMEDASYVPKLMSPSYRKSIEDSYEVNEDHLMASQDQAEQEAGSRVLKGGSPVYVGLAPEKRGFTPSQTMQTAQSEQAIPPEQGVATQMIGPRDTMGAGAEWEDGKAQDSPLVQVLRVTDNISPESIVAADCAINGPRNFKRARAEKADLKTLGEDKVLTSTPGLGREARRESALEYRSANLKPLFRDQQGGTMDDISAALYQQQTSRLSENMRANQGILLKLKNIWRRLARPKALPGHERLEWRCVSLPLRTS
jgi:hypothetical protein